MDITSTGLGSQPVYGSYAVVGKTQPAAQSIGDKTKSEFLEYAHMTMAEMIEDAILKELGLTKEELDAMPPEQKQAVMEKIAERMKEKLKEKIENQDGVSVSGSFADMVA